MPRPRFTALRLAARRCAPCRSQPQSPASCRRGAPARGAASACAAMPRARGGARLQRASPAAVARSQPIRSKETPKTGHRARAARRCRHRCHAQALRCCHRTPSCAACPGCALPRYALLRAAAAGSRWALGPPLLTLARGRRWRRALRGTRAVLRGCVHEVTALKCLLIFLIRCFSLDRVSNGYGWTLLYASGGPKS